ncbi:MAG: beta-lactamase family protein, partial [Pseudomonadota bacterium]|nr:beta-lactamase family protein [Pseudomonadota bacterium]
MDQALVPGLAVAVIQNGRTASVRSFGVADTRDGRPVTAETVFEAASLGKPVLGYGVLKLAAAGRIDLDAPLVRYAPALAKDPTSPLARITARHVLAHRSGLPNQSGGAPSAGFEPGTRFSYSGEGFLQLQTVVEAITGEPLERYMAREVFAPLGMTRTSFVWRDDYAALKAAGHDRTGAFAGRTRTRRARAHASLETTAGDYARFVTAVLNDEGLPAGSLARLVASAQPVEEGCVVCLDGPARPPSNSVSWSLGWGVASGPDGPWLWHWGDNGTAQSYVAASPESRRGVVMFANSANGQAIFPALAEAALEAPAPGYAWLSVYERHDAPSRRLLRALVRGGSEATESALQAVSPAETRTVAGWLLRRRPVEAARLYRRLAPLGRADDHAGLAEALRRSGDPAGARAALARAFALEPGDRTA